MANTFFFDFSQTGSVILTADGKKRKYPSSVLSYERTPADGSYFKIYAYGRTVTEFDHSDINNNITPLAVNADDFETAIAPFIGVPSGMGGGNTILQRIGAFYRLTDQEIPLNNVAEAVRFTGGVFDTNFIDLQNETDIIFKFDGNIQQNTRLNIRRDANNGGADFFGRVLKNSIQDGFTIPSALNTSRSLDSIPDVSQFSVSNNDVLNIEVLRTQGDGGLEAVNVPSGWAPAPSALVVFYII